uniref:Uncharacterized protein n=1 Tax=Anopheles quadriannulatus TaxID=34691 RepID=A0A182WWL3_ANOQN
MIKLVCLFALVAVVASMPNGPFAPLPPMQAPMRQIVKREAVAPVAVAEDAPVQESAVEAQDDMDKAETFGFGYHKVIHVGVPYYPPYYHYPRYYHGYHAVSAMPRAPEWHPAPRPAPMGRLVKRDVQQPFPKQMPNNEENAKEEAVAVAGEDDMDKAETFGFGYHHYYAYPRYYYPSYHYGYYPSYHYGYYWI